MPTLIIKDVSEDIINGIQEIAHTVNRSTNTQVNCWLEKMVQNWKSRQAREEILKKMCNKYQQSFF
tara:strand:- start:136 stop:333 length:198 start_codon:yes stop_codon:yes gene_type:complete